MNNNANIHIINQKGQNAVNMAASIGITNTVALLIKAGADINCKDNQGKSALHFIREKKLVVGLPNKVFKDLENEEKKREAEKKKLEQEIVEGFQAKKRKINDEEEDDVICLDETNNFCDQVTSQPTRSPSQTSKPSSGSLPATTQ